MPTDTRNIVMTVEVAGEGTYKKKLDGISKSLKTLASEQKVVDAQYSKSDKSLAALASRQEIFRKQLELQRAKLETIREEYAKTSKAMGENADESQKLNREMNYANAAMIKTERTLREIEEAMQEAAEAAEETGDALEDAAESQEELGDAAEKAATKLKKIGTASRDQKEALKQLGKQAEETAGKLSKALTAATVTTIGVSAKEYMEFEAQMSNVATLADTTAVSLDDLADQALKASNKTGVAATDISQGAYAALSAGVDTANVMEYVTEAAKAAKAGQGELDDVIQGSTSIMNAWKLSYSDATGVFEKLLVAQDLGQTTLGEISSQIGQLTGLAPQLNVSLEETLAAVAALTKSTGQTSQSINGLKAVMAGVIKPTAEATKTAQELGLEFDAAALKSKGLTGFLADVMEKTGGSEEILAKLFGSVEGLSQVMLLGGGAADDYAQALAAMESSAGKLDKAFATVTDNSASRLQMSLNKIKNEAIKFGEQLAPYIDIASDALGTLAEKIGALSDEEKMGILQTAAWVAAGLKLVSIASKLTTTIKLMGTAAGPVGLTAASLAALTASLIALDKAAQSATIDAAIDKFEDALNTNYSGEMAATINASIDTTDALSAIEAAIAELNTALTGMEVLTPDDQAAIIATIRGDMEPIELAMAAGVKIDAATLGENIGNEQAIFVEALKGFGLTDDQINEIVAVYQDAADNLALKVPNVYETIKSALTDGEADTTEVVEGVKSEVTGMFDDAETKLAGMGDEAAGYAETLKSLEAETTAWIDSMAGMSTEYVLAHLGELEAIQAMVQEVMSEIDAANAALNSEGAQAYDIVRSGGSTSQDTIALAGQYIYQGYKLDVQEIEDKAAADRAALDKAYIDGFIDETEHLTGEQKIQAEADVATEAVTKEYEKKRDEYIAGIMKAFALTEPEQVELLGTVANYLNQTKAQDMLHDKLVKEQYGFLAPLWDTGVGTWIAEQMYPDDTEFRTALEKLSTEDGSLMDTFNEILASEIGSGIDIDTTDAGSIARYAYSFVGDSAVSGLEEGLQDPDGKVEKASEGLVSSSVSSAKKAVTGEVGGTGMYAVGMAAVESLAAGVAARKSVLVSQMQAVAQAAVDAARRTLMGSDYAEGGSSSSSSSSSSSGRTGDKSSGGNTTVNVSYSGAFTRKEAKNFGRELADQLKAEASGKGG